MDGYQTRIRYFDGHSRDALIREHEVPFPDGRLIVSRTDTCGIITHCNQAFVEMSGYPERELIGQPHSILRHPDMPRAAFQDLWETVQAGRKWHGHVKNLRKDGSCYWVLATVIPNVRHGRIAGYTSVRRKPARSRIHESIALYARLREAENP
ncbi:MAG: PAS domain-containing protein [Thiothrix sp.]|nr:PAS domain-containing protein [Thiothrix sp.]